MGADAHFHFQVVVDGTDQGRGRLPLMKGPLGDFQLLVGPQTTARAPSSSFPQMVWST